MNLICPECAAAGREYAAKSLAGLGRHRTVHGVRGTSKATRSYHARRAAGGPRRIVPTFADAKRPVIYREDPLDRDEREKLRRRLLYTVNHFAAEVKRYPKAVLASLREIVASGFVPDRALVVHHSDPEDSFGSQVAETASVVRGGPSRGTLVAS